MRTLLLLLALAGPLAAQPLKTVVVDDGTPPAEAKALPDGHPNISIKAAQQVANQVPAGSEGVCWWAAAETIGNYLGIEGLKGLTDRVVKTGVGLKGGATDADIDTWHKTLGVTVEKGPAGKTEAGIQWVRAKLDAGLPVIVGVSFQVRDARGQVRTVKHVFTLVYLSYGPVRTQDPYGRWSEDYVARYLDCNRPGQTYEIPWTTFLTQYTGDKWAYSRPKGPEAPEAAGEGDRGPTGRLLLATHGPGKVVDPKIVARVREQLGEKPDQPARTLVPTHLGTFALEVDPKGGHPLVTGIVPSNQDIKDGVSRPRDTIETSAFGRYYFGEYDYYAEYRQRVAQGKVKLPAEEKK